MEVNPEAEPEATPGTSVSSQDGPSSKGYIRPSEAKTKKKEGAQKFPDFWKKGLNVK